MIEMNERYSDCTFRLILVKSAKGDVPTRDTLFRGNSGNKMLDNFNNERYTIMMSKYYKLTARSVGTIGAAQGTLVIPAGFNTATDANLVLSRATKIIRVYLPGRLFGAGGKIVYDTA
jgi:hypothetical protein